MKLYAILFIAALTASAAQAQTYLCPDGSYITRNSSAPTVLVTIDGKTEQCVLTASAPPVGMCSTQSTDKCAGQQQNYGDCTTKFGEYGKCFPSDNLGSDGNVICGCGVGE